MFTPAKRVLIEVPEEWPLIGCIAFGIIDRGTSLIQIRPSSSCPLSCIFCSTDAGPSSRNRQAEFIVDVEHIIKWIKYVLNYKRSKSIEAHIDTVGDPLTYPKIVDLIHKLSEIPKIKVISMQTRGTLLSYKLIDDMEAAGLSRINLSIDAMNPELAKKLAGTDNYDLNHVLKMAEAVANSKVDLLIAPVWVPGYNNNEIPKIIEYALKIKAGKRWPPLGIQKYVPHKYGRKPKKVKTMTWFKFYRELRRLEEMFHVKLVLTPEDFGIVEDTKLPLSFKRGDKVSVHVVSHGWLRGEKLAITPRENRLVTLINASHIKIGSKVLSRILTCKDNVYVAEPL
ncbi:MAG: radical SAM protein [Candidatus Nezhaarchaeota archaeon]|nr:radical SAM protein [Candidatus Nezhaarchaeota archaeon]MCX8142042.1 radical SAM protein [Candidatus Nezhaarchaeota archaeon]MDW8050177.1 radical SAM protein [Nitrososphaerota archaeon]